MYWLAGWLDGYLDGLHEFITVLSFVVLESMVLWEIYMCVHVCTVLALCTYVESVEYSVEM